MLNGLKVVDSDSHAMEPEDLWDRYLDREFRGLAPRHRRLSPTYRYFGAMDILGHSLGIEQGPTMDDAMFVSDGRGGLVSVGEAYVSYIDAGFSPRSYLEYMDSVGIDHMFIYPTFGLLSTGVPDMPAPLAAAIKRAYNNWLYEFCQEGAGRLHGVAALDLRDVGLAVVEARRCVKELGYRTVYVLPDHPFEGRPLDHPSHDELWAEVAALGVPLGTHEGNAHQTGEVGYVGSHHLIGCKVPYAVNAVTFGFGQMLAALMFTGSICARHPDLKVVFTESSVGSAATWLAFLDEKWENSSLMHGGRGLPEHPPSYYFRRQCYISGEAGEAGYGYAVEAGLEDCLMAASDFPHPEDHNFPRVLDKFFDGRHVQLDRRVLEKIFWDTPAQLYGLS